MTIKPLAKLMRKYGLKPCPCESCPARMMNVLTILIKKKVKEIEDKR